MIDADDVELSEEALDRVARLLLDAEDPPIGTTDEKAAS